MYKKRPHLKPSQFRKLKQLRKRVVYERDSVLQHEHEVKEELYDSSYDDASVWVSFRVGRKSEAQNDGPIGWDYWFILIGPKGKAMVYCAPKPYHRFAGTYVPYLGMHVNKLVK